MEWDTAVSRKGNFVCWTSIYFFLSFLGSASLTVSKYLVSLSPDDPIEV